MPEKTALLQALVWLIFQGHRSPAHIQVDNIRCHGLRGTTLTMMMQGGFTEAECNQFEGWQQADLRMSARYDRNYAGREVPSRHLAGCRQLGSRFANLD